jgi:hypothetical protein
LFLDIYDSFDSYAIIDVLWYGKIEIFTIANHTSSIPHLSKGSLWVFFIKKICIDQNIIVTIVIKVLGVNSKCKIYVIVFIILSFWLIASDNNWISFFDISLYPLKKIFVLRFWMFAVPCLIDKWKLFKSLLGIFSNQYFRLCYLPHLILADIASIVESYGLYRCLSTKSMPILPLKAWRNV